MVNYKKDCPDKKCNSELNPLYQKEDQRSMQIVQKWEKGRIYRAYYCPKCKELKWIYNW